MERMKGFGKNGIQQDNLKERQNLKQAKPLTKRGRKVS